MTISIILAAARDGLIGRENRLPWHLPRDLKRFRRLTLGKPIVMGRRTFESLGRPLDARRNIVLSRRLDYHLEGAEVVGSLSEAIALARDGLRSPHPDEVVIIGGAELFREALPFADRIYLTVVDGEFLGDTYFPLDSIDSTAWRVVEQEDFPADARNAHPHHFAILERNPAPAPSG